MERKGRQDSPVANAQSDGVYGVGRATEVCMSLVVLLIVVALLPGCAARQEGKFTDAVYDGDVRTAQELLSQHPGLVKLTGDPFVNKGTEPFIDKRSGRLYTAAMLRVARSVVEEADRERLNKGLSPLIFPINPILHRHVSVVCSAGCSCTYQGECDDTNWYD